MLKNYLAITLRTLVRYKNYTLINVVGLAVGLAACLLIVLFVQDERSYDRYHTNGEHVYRLTEQQLDTDGEVSVHSVFIDPGYAPLLKAEIPEVTHAARLTPVGPLLSVGERHVDSGDAYWSDPDLFEVLTFSFLAGTPETALVEPFSLVLSASKARALFDRTDVVGETVVVNNNEAFTVTGVFADLPVHTHAPVDVVGSMTTLERWFSRPLLWDSPNYATYVRLAEGATVEQVAEKLPAFMAQHRGEEVASQSRWHLQALASIHLHSHLVGELAPNGNIRYVYLFSAIALFILLIACINFTNLATARASLRAKEVGVRKVSGAQRSALVYQFLGEAVLLAGLSVTLAIMLVELALPFFNTLTEKTLVLPYAKPLVFVAWFAGLTLLVGLAAGAYPAFYLSALRPAAVLKGAQAKGKRSWLRSSLVVMQFAIAIVLMTGTAVVYQQLSFIRNQNLGFDKEHILVLPGIGDVREDFAPFREQLLQHPDIVAVSQSNPVPFRSLFFSFEAETQHAATNETTESSLYPLFADADFFDTYTIPFVAGTNFIDEQDHEADRGFILNETAVRQMGWASPDEALNQPLRVGGQRGSVIGVVQDFHAESLHNTIAPMVFYRDARNYRRVSLKLRAGTDVTPLLAFLETKWQQYDPNWPLSYAFLDEYFDAAYRSEQKLGQLSGYFAGLAVFITCLGLFGMATFVMERRTKEVGIRKVLGASVSSLLMLLSRQFGGLVALAFLLAAPIAYLILQQWLTTFAYQITLGWGIFALVGLSALGIACLTIGYHALRTAFDNPIRALRQE